MHAGIKSLIVLCSIIAITTFAFVYANRQGKEQTKTNQDPQYIIEAREIIIGVWYEKDNPNNILELNMLDLCFIEMRMSQKKDILIKSLIQHKSAGKRF